MSTQATYRTYSGTAAQNYERYFVPAIGAPAADRLLETARLQPGERVLDVACGTGIVARQVRDRVGPEGGVVGVDLAPDMIEVARATTPEGVDWKLGDATSLPVDDGAFDVVLCQLGLMFIDDKPTALAEMRRALAPGGRLALNVPGHVQPPFVIMDEALAMHVNPDLAGFVKVVFSMHDPDALAALVSGAGFDEVEVATAAVPLRLPPPAEFLWQYLNATPVGGFLADVPDEALTALEREVVTRWEPFVEDGGVRFDQPTLTVTARA